MYKVLRDTIKLCLKLLFSLLPSGNIILFESHPDFADNTYPVYLMLRKYLPSYKMVWFLHGDDKKDSDDFIHIPTLGLLEKLKYIYYMARCKVLIQCNGSAAKIKGSQLSIYLDHGSPGKDIRGMYDLQRDNIDFHNVHSEFFDNFTLQTNNGRQEQLVHLGFPRCDYFFHTPRTKDIADIVSGKYIIWLPTFRGHKNKLRNDAPNSPYNHIGIPLFYSVEKLSSFNAFLKDNDIHILYKPHPVQDLGVLKGEKMSNFRITYDPDIFSRNLQLYEVIAQSEALITDYSSVFWDYLILDRPIAITVDDIALWKEGRGFLYDIESIHKETAEILPDEKSMREFILNVINGSDIKREGRRKWRDKAIIHQDGKSTERVVNFILEKMSRS